MSLTDTQALLDRLKALPEGVTLSELLAEQESSLPKQTIEARRRCALVRGFDEDLYAFLVAGVDGAPPHDELVKSRDFRQVGAERWAMEEPARARVLHASWRGPLEEPEWKAWNSRIARYLVVRGRAEDRLDALYHFCLSDAPERGVELFRRWYAEADERFDLAQCYALLETLRVQSTDRGEALTGEWREHDRYYRTRLHFLDYYYKSGAYFERAGPLEAFEDVLLRGEQQRWILHMHATGGTGKTMFQRWLIARYLVPRRIPCARLDFDDFDLTRATEYPLQLFARIFQHWAEQVPGDKLNSLVLSLSHEEDIKGWNRNVLAEVRRSLLGAQLDMPLVVMLDTLEDVTLTKQAWLEECVRSLRELHDVYPKLIVMLAGRYNIVEHCEALRENEYVSYELLRFSEEEAHRYLEKRGIPASEARDAIVERTAGGECDDAEELRGRNPFKLALFAELALGRSSLTPADVWAFPRVDVAYLIERVIKRIKAQPLRWTIRYGAIARHLTKEFIEAVLLPPLRQALRGDVADLPSSQLAEGFADAWLPDPDNAERVDAQQLWEELAQYSRDRGWISLIGDGASAELRFHPDVVVPTRQLLRQQPIHGQLQQLAVSYHERRVDVAMRMSETTEQQRQSIVSDLCAAVFHRFQWEGPAAHDYWISSVRLAERSVGLVAAARVASEITGRDYAHRQREPLLHVITEAMLAEAHCEAADLLMQSAGRALGPTHAYYPEFIQRIELAQAIEGASNATYVPGLLRVLREALLAPPESAIAMLESARRSTPQPRERFFLCLQLGRLLRMTAPVRAAERYEEAFEILPAVERAGADAFAFSMLLVDVYREIGADQEVHRWFARAADLAGDDAQLVATVNYAQARDALAVDDFQAVALHIRQLEQLPVSAHPRATALSMLKVRLALANYDAPEVLRLTRAAREVAVTDIEQAWLWDQEGEAQALRLAFNAAFEAWDVAASCYDAAGDQIRSARCALLAAHLKATSCGDMLDALAMIEGAGQLRGMQNSELYAEFTMLRCYALYRRRLTAPARTIFSELLAGNQSAWSAALQARTRLFGVLFTLVEPAPDYIEELLDAIGRVQPISARVTLLDWCAYSDVTLSIDSEARARLRELFDTPASRTAHPRDYINRADLYRIVGDIDMGTHLLDASEGVLAGASSWSGVLEHWLVHRARRRLGRRTDFRSVLREAEKVGLQDPLLDAIRMEAAIETARADRKQTAEQLANAGFANLLQEGRSVWHGRVLELQAEIESGAERATRFAEASELYASLGDQIRVQAMSIRMAQAQAPGATTVPMPASASTVPESNVALIDVAEASPSHVQRLAKEASSYDVIIDRMMSDLPRFSDNLSELLREVHDSRVSLNRVGLRLPTSLESLPWELATVLADCELVCRIGAEPSSFGSTVVQQQPRILLLRPEEDSELSLGNASGGSIESMYQGREAELRVLYSPQPAEVEEALHSWRPALIHINASMVESGHGSYLDFTGKRARTKLLFKKGSEDDTQRFALEWSAPRLARRIEGARSRCSPVVVLDISSDENRAEAIRGLLLRNSYCAQLARYAQCRAVIGAGLGTLRERGRLTSGLVWGLKERTVAEVVAALRSAPVDYDQLQSILPRRGVALWARNPHIRAIEARK